MRHFLIYHAYNLYFIHRTQLITTLNAKAAIRRRSSNFSTIRRTPSRPTSVLKPPQIALRKQDYPNVKHWERRPNDTIQLSVIKVYDTDHPSDCDDSSRENEGLTNQETGVLAFLEDENGKVISHHERRRLYSELRGFWNDNIDPTDPPDNWSSAGSSLRDKFWNILEEKFPFLRFCAGRWKVEALWKKNYHSWKRSFMARQARKRPLGSSDGGKRRHLEPVDSDSGIVDSDAPQLLAKKRKITAASIPITSGSQRVR